MPAADCSEAPKEDKQDPVEEIKQQSEVEAQETQKLQAKEVLAFQIDPFPPLNDNDIRIKYVGHLSQASFGS